MAVQLKARAAAWPVVRRRALVCRARTGDPLLPAMRTTQRAAVVRYWRAWRLAHGRDPDIPTHQGRAYHCYRNALRLALMREQRRQAAVLELARLEAQEAADVENGRTVSPIDKRFSWANR